jgi:uncharacterized integral membrane protein (TIGR00698 family)
MLSPLALSRRSDARVLRRSQSGDVWLGILASVVLAIAASYGARYVPLLGPPVLAIVLGVLIRAVLPLPASFGVGLAFASRNVLQAAIVVSGFGLSLVTVVRTGLATLPVTLVTIAVALVLGTLLGRLLRVDGALRQLVSVGTAICGASAIAAVSTVIEPEDGEVALSIATIFLYNIIAVLIFPPLGHLMHLTQNAFGVWAGTAINDTSSVVAAGYAYGHQAGAEATIVKLARASLILPLVAVIALRRARSRTPSGSGRVPWMKIVPWFIVWFLLAAIVNSTGVVPPGWHGPIAEVAVFLISVALAAIGLQTQLRTLVRTGARPLALGFCLWAAVALSSLAVQHLTGL